MSSSSTDNEQPKVAAINREQLISGATPLGDALLGRELADRYLITHLLGTGAMGVVYKARHKVLNREVAIKILKREASGDELSRRRFETEARAAGSLNHPNLIAVHDSGFMEDCTPFLVMDYLEGESLGSVLKREKRLETMRLLTIFKQVCTGLAYAHSKGLVHRDLKPNNIMLMDYANGRDLVKIVDFGIVKPIGSDQELTETGQIFGTPFYMSPEQCQGKPLDGRSDIYALGCLFYRIVAGKPPFTGDSAVATIVMHVKDPPPPIAPDHLDSEVLRALEPVLLKMLAKEPADRYQTTDELRADLERIENEHKTDRLPAVPEPQPAVDPGPAFDPRKMIALTVGGLLAAMLIVALVGASLFDKPTLKVPVQQAPPPVTVASPSPAATPSPTISPKPAPRQKARKIRRAPHREGGLKGFFKRLLD